MASFLFFRYRYLKYFIIDAKLIMSLWRGSHGYQVARCCGRGRDHHVPGMGAGGGQVSTLSGGCRGRRFRHGVIAYRRDARVLPQLPEVVLRRGRSHGGPDAADGAEEAVPGRPGLPDPGASDAPLPEGRVKHAPKRFGGSPDCRTDRRGQSKTAFSRLFLFMEK